MKKNIEENKEIEEKHAVTKGGWYANLSGNTKGFTIFIIICSIVFIGLMIYILVK